MIQLTPQMRILVAISPVDFRKGIDGLAQLCRAALHADPFSGTVFVFRNRQRTALKLLVYDGRGFWLCHRRFSQGKLRWWPQSPDKCVTQLESHQITVLLCGGNPEKISASPLWRAITPVEEATL